MSENAKKLIAIQTQLCILLVHGDLFDVLVWFDRMQGTINTILEVDIHCIWLVSD